MTSTIRLFVEDSGPGIPPDKKKQLFLKFQSSLDSLNQGTGIGLNLCEKLTQVLDMDLWLDESYDSGIQGRPGARFVIDLKKPALSPEDLPAGTADHSIRSIAPDGNDQHQQPNVPSSFDLPLHLSVLFVDDDTVLRKLFVRTVRKICPTWSIREASSGEAALQMVQEIQEQKKSDHTLKQDVEQATPGVAGQGISCSAPFDLIFVDQYMASADRQLLGTETVRALRLAMDCSVSHCCICGLSANDLDSAFRAAGANSFWCKPFPTNPSTLQAALHELLQHPELDGEQ